MLTIQNAINVLYFGTATIQTFVYYLIVSDPFHEEKEFLYPLEINHSSSDRPRDSQGILTGHIEDVAPHLSPCIHPGLNDLQRKIIQCFILPSDHSKQSHLVFAFMYHVEKRYGNLIGFDQEGRPIIQLNDEDKFLNADRYSSPVLREGLVEIAKETVKEMFDPVLQRVNLVYNTETMKPAWHVPDLLTAMYLSLYYMDTSAILRRCEICGQLFEVSLTNHAKKHCGERCRKAQANRKYNQKRKRSKGSVDRR